MAEYIVCVNGIQVAPRIDFDDSEVTDGTSFPSIQKTINRKLLLLDNRRVWVNWEHVATLEMLRLKEAQG